MNIMTLSPEQISVSSCRNQTSFPEKDEKVLIFAIFTMLFCVLGMLGNGFIIWLLSFSIKRNTFAIYFLNLSVADFGLLTTELIIKIHWLFTHLYCDFPYELFQTVLLFMYSRGQFLLTVISIDRCISVLFPIWYRCHQPVHLFTTVCAVIWAVSFILSSIHFTTAAIHGYEPKYTMKYHFIVNAVLCLPLMTISSIILFIKICFVTKSQRQRKLLTVVLLTLFFFLVLAFPLNVFYFIQYSPNYIHPNFVHYGYLCTCINSSIKPLIYYLMGRQKGKTQRSIKDLLQLVFKQEENCSDQMETSESSTI